MDHWYEDLLSNIYCAKSEQSLYKIIQFASLQLGFEFCAMGIEFPYSVLHPALHPSLLLLNNYPTKWQGIYNTSDYIKIDPIVLYGRKTDNPIVWSRSCFPKNLRFFEEAESFGLKYGWSQSHHDNSGAASMLTLARSGELISPHELQANEIKMRFLTSTAHSALLKILISKEKQFLVANLTDREITVLHLSAEGQSAIDIAKILSVGKSTIDFHIKNAIEKLQASNKTEAVARAITLGLLR